MPKFTKNILPCLVAAVLLCGVVVYFYVRASKVQTVETFAMPVNRRVIVIDAGHGGFDPGVIGVSGLEEKTINLAIAEKLQILLEAGGAHVIMTRIDDSAIARTKRADMDSRRKIANESDADIFISIHANSYPCASVRGAQAFYYTGSEQGKLLAELIQDQFRQLLDRNKRNATGNENYYVLKRITIPSVLVETGYLTNPNESKLLTGEEYQYKVAWAIYMGVLNFFAQ